MESSFGERLKKFRKKAGLTQEELADIIGVEHNSISRWEKTTDIPKVQNLQALAKALNVSESDLLNDLPPQPDGWVLTVRMSMTNEHNEEVIAMTASTVPVMSTVVNRPDGGWLYLGGNYELWEDDAGFEKIVKELRKRRELVIAGGISYGKLSGKLSQKDGKERKRKK